VCVRGAILGVAILVGGGGGGPGDYSTWLHCLCARAACKRGERLLQYCNWIAYLQGLFSAYVLFQQTSCSGRHDKHM